MGCRKKRSLRTKSWFEDFPRISLGMPLLCVYYFVCEDTQRKTARRLNMNQGLVSRIFRRLQDVCDGPGGETGDTLWGARCCRKV